MSSFNPKLKDILGRPAPAGYIAGMGRGYDACMVLALR